MGSGGIDIPPNTVKATEGFFLLRQNARVESFQPHMHLRGKAMAMEAILPNGQTQMLSHVDNFNFNWHNSYVYTDDAAPLLPEGHAAQDHRVARQHGREQGESRAEHLGGLRRPHRRRDGARVGQRHLHGRRGLSRRGRDAPRRAAERHARNAGVQGWDWRYGTRFRWMPPAR